MAPENQARPRCDGEKTEMEWEGKRERGKGRREDGTLPGVGCVSWGSETYVGNKMMQIRCSQGGARRNSLGARGELRTLRGDTLAKKRV